MFQGYFLTDLLLIFFGSRLSLLPKLREILLNNAELFAQHVERMSDQKLDEVFVDRKYSSYRQNIDGMIEHGCYRLGQISLLVKFLT